MSASVVTSSLPDIQQAEHEDLLRLLGFLLLSCGHVEKAALAFDVLHLLAPDDEQVVLSLSYAWIRSGRSFDALQLIDSVSSPIQDPATLALLRGKALSKLGRGIEAARAMRTFTRLLQREKTREI